MKSNYKQLGRYIRPVDVRNRDLAVSRLLGVGIAKEFMPSIANTVGTDMSNYKVVRKGQFAYGPVTSRNGDKISVALLREPECIISQAYTAFEIINTEALDPEYLMLWFSRPEFDRYARYHSHGSVREIFSWDDMCRVELPVPDIKEQKKIVTRVKGIDRRLNAISGVESSLYSAVTTLYYEWIEKGKSPYSLIKSEVELPKGRGGVALGDLIESYSKSHSFSRDRLVFLNTSDIYNGIVLKHDTMSVCDMPGQAKKKIQKGDILFSEIRPANRRFAFVDFDSDDYVVSTKLMVLRPIQSNVSARRIYHYLTLEKTLQDLHREADGKSGTFPQITFDENLRNRQLPIADKETERIFETILTEFYTFEQDVKKEKELLQHVRAIVAQQISAY